MLRLKIVAGDSALASFLVKKETCLMNRCALLIDEFLVRCKELSDSVVWDSTVISGYFLDFDSSSVI